MTNYQLAKLVNYRLTELGMSTVRPQQIYGDRKGLTDLETPEKVLSYIESYVEKRRKLGTNGRSKSVNPQEWFAKNAVTVKSIEL